MKRKIIFLFVACLFCSWSSIAGGNFIFKKLKLKSIGVNGGVEQDLIMGNKMSHKYFNSMVNDPNINSNLEDFVDANFWKHSGVCENPHFRINLAYELPKPNRELHLNLIGVFNRVDGIHYNRYDPSNNNSYYDYLSYNLYSHEMALETNYVFKKELNVIKNVLGLNLYGLGGTNLGFQFGNELSISGTETIRDRQLGARISADDNTVSNYTFDSQEDFDNYYDASNAINQRVYAGAGLGFLFFNRVELGVNGKFGYGYRYHFSNDFATTNLRSIDFSAKWVLK